MELQQDIFIMVAEDQKDRCCKNPYIREEELTNQLIKVLDKIDLNETGVKIKFEEELKRYNKFNRGVFRNPKQKHKT